MRIKGPDGRWIKAQPPEERFWEYVERGEGCWLWTGGFNSWGYGQFWDGETTMQAHRFSYRLAKGPIRHQIDHLCRNRGCVNPDHLEDVTARENLIRSPLTQAGIAVRGGETHLMQWRRRP